MQSAAVCFVLALVTLSAAYPLEHDDGDFYPVERVRRQAPSIDDFGGQDGNGTARFQRNFGDNPVRQLYGRVGDRGTWSVSGNMDRSTDASGRTQETSYVRGDAGYNLIRGRDGNSGLYGTAHYQRNFGDNPVRQQYGLGFEHRSDRGSIGVGATQTTGKDSQGSWRNNNVRGEANYDLYRSRDSKTRVTGNAYYERSVGGSPSRSGYGVGVTLRRNL